MTPWLPLALSAALTLPPAGATPKIQDNFDFEDDLDALLDGEIAEDGGVLSGVLRGFQGFVALEPRVYLKDRGGRRNDEQFLVTSEIELDLRFSDDVTGYVRPRFLIDLLDGDYDRFEPFEAYATWEGDTWDVRAGSFVENWGIVDTYNPVDVLNRRDFGSDLLDADRLGEVGLRLRGKFEGNDTFGQPTISAYVLPSFRETPFAPEDQRFAVSFGGVDLDENAAFTPEGEDRVFYGIRAQSTVSTGAFNADLQIVAADGPGRFPGVGLVGASLAPVYHRATTFGAGIRAVPNEDVLGSQLAKLTLKAEIAHTRTEAYDDAPFAAPDDYTALVVGVDRIFDGVFGDQDSLTATVEFATEAGANDVQSTFRPFRNDVILRAFWEANDFERTSLELRALVDLDDHETIGELLYETQLRRWNEDLKLQVQAQVFDAASAGESFYSLFPNNSSLLVGLRWDV